jgi:hypothetical protein
MSDHHTMYMIYDYNRGLQSALILKYLLRKLIRISGYSFVIRAFLSYQNKFSAITVPFSDWIILSELTSSNLFDMWHLSPSTGLDLHLVRYSNYFQTQPVLSQVELTSSVYLGRFFEREIFVRKAGVLHRHCRSGNDVCLFSRT